MSCALRGQNESGGGAIPNHSAQSRSQLDKLLLPVPLSQPRRYRAQVLQTERLQACRHALSPERREFPRHSLHRGKSQLLVMSLGPKKF
jgi:hypothetical protein